MLWQYRVGERYYVVCFVCLGLCSGIVLVLFLGRLWCLLVFLFFGNILFIM